eukprot:TRINITY_DN63819_c0_g1_i1.p1 TRINITY_DN63819_c0_g1~~TRINITY_DN63819_c0_g1_i1.p1  ORF type:complete len:834 (+),score=153.24 TRINITY_DN63819_c0_g1_i1:117-2618(+)
MASDNEISTVAPLPGEAPTGEAALSEGKRELLRVPTADGIEVNYASGSDRTSISMLGDILKEGDDEGIHSMPAGFVSTVMVPSVPSRNPSRSNTRNPSMISFTPSLSRKLGRGSTRSRAPSQDQGSPLSSPSEAVVKQVESQLHRAREALAARHEEVLSLLAGRRTSLTQPQPSCVRRPAKLGTVTKRSLEEARRNSDSRANRERSGSISCSQSPKRLQRTLSRESANSNDRDGMYEHDNRSAFDGTPFFPDVAVSSDKYTVKDTFADTIVPSNPSSPKMLIRRSSEESMMAALDFRPIESIKMPARRLSQIAPHVGRQPTLERGNPITPELLGDLKPPERTASSLLRAMGLPMRRPSVSFMRQPPPAPKQISQLESMDSRKSVFPDAAETKAKLKRELMEGQYNVTKYYKKEGRFQAIARHQMFETCTLTVILLNAIWLAIECDYNEAETLNDADTFVQVFENMFCAFFTGELLIRYFAFAKKCDALTDRWFAFDLALVSMMIFETWVFAFFLAVSSSSMMDSIASNSGILRILRLLRMSRMMRLIRLLRALPELMIFLRGMLVATRAVILTMCLLSIVMYAFAIALRHLTRGLPAGDLYFNSIPECMYTLMVHGTLLDAIHIVLNAIRQDSPVAFVLMTGYVMLATLTVLNMLIGVLCQMVSIVTMTEHERMDIVFVKTELQKVLKKHLKNPDFKAMFEASQGGTDFSEVKISDQAFATIMEDSQVLRVLDTVGVDIDAVVDFADIIFERDLYQEEDVSLSFQSFVEVLLQFRGANPATVKDLVLLRQCMSLQLRNMEGRFRGGFELLRGTSGASTPRSEEEEAITPRLIQ